MFTINKSGVRDINVNCSKILESFWNFLIVGFPAYLMSMSFISNFKFSAILKIIAPRNFVFLANMIKVFILHQISSLPSAVLSVDGHPHGNVC